MARESFPIGQFRIRAGQAREIELPMTRLVTGADLSLPVRVVHGRGEGPRVWVVAATHGDEVVGVEVIRRVLAGLDPKTLRGTLVAVPIANVLGFMAGQRYLPDRRDLNRCFPGSVRGSMGSRLAHLLMTEVVQRCEVGIDLHTGAFARTNLPQIRADLDDPRTRALAHAFGAPIVVHAKLRDGSLRQAARERGSTVLLYEGGEAWRFDEWAIEAGVTGVQRVLTALDMIGPPGGAPALDADPAAPVGGAAGFPGGGPAGLATVAESRSTGWVRARSAGIVRLDVTLGLRVSEGDRLGSVADSFGRRVHLVRADRDGLVIGHTHAPLVNRGDALVHIATVD